MDFGRQQGDSMSASLDGLRLASITRIASLLESQTRSHQLISNLRRLLQQEQCEVIDRLEALARSPADAELGKELEVITAHCRALMKTRAALIDERNQAWYKNGDYTRELMLDINAASRLLKDTLIDRDLLDRENRVLESIVLSYEKVAHWQEFVAEILKKFHAIFPFDLFFMAFAEEHSLRLYLYHMHAHSPEMSAAIRQRFPRELLLRLGLSEHTTLELEEVTVFDAPTAEYDPEDLHLLFVSLPTYTLGEGVLALAYASRQPLSQPEEAILESLLSILVMVISSSKMLSHSIDELEYYSRHDSLTGLNNRRFFYDALEYELKRSRRHGHAFTLLFVDIDDFKDVNDVYGHPHGDRVLRQLAEVIRNNLRNDDVATRIGGDEFALLLPETSREGGQAVADQLREAVRALSFTSEHGEPFTITISIGMVSYPEDADNSTELMAGVDLALYQAKGVGKDQIANIGSLKEVLERKQQLRSQVESLRQALRQGRIVPYYQRIISCQSGEIFAHETLARLLRDDGHPVAAGQFIELVEQYGLSMQLDTAIIHGALLALRARLDQGEAESRLFINLSVQQMQNREVLGYAEGLCEQLQLPRNMLVFEILERDAISEINRMREFLTELRDKGFAFALDDFGSGYNSFHYLRELRFEYVKIDGAYVRNILNSTTDMALVRNLTHLCQDLGIKTIAEFVENAGILTELQAIGVDYAQGYHLSMPLADMT